MGQRSQGGTPLELLALRLEEGIKGQDFWEPQEAGSGFGRDTEGNCAIRNGFCHLPMCRSPRPPGRKATQ